MVMGSGSLMLGSVFLMLFVIALSILSFIFWILMLVDSIKRKYKNSDDRIIWVVVIALTGAIGAIIYYFAVKRENKKN